MMRKKIEYLREQKFKRALNQKEPINEEEEIDENEEVPQNIFEEVNIDWEPTKIKTKLVEFLDSKLVAMTQVPEIVRYPMPMPLLSLRF